MQYQRFLIPGIIAILCGLGASLTGTLSAQSQHVIPFAGNAYLTSEHPGAPDRMDRSGIRNWQSKETLFSVWFHAGKPATLALALQMEVPEGESELLVTAGGMSFTVKAAGGMKIYPVGEIEVKEPGYVRIDLQGIRRSGSEFARPADLVVSSDDDNLAVTFVKDNESNRFYWGRRGPSVHLTYTTPPERELEWFYNEITVPAGEDVTGSYFMANGFAEGYFGIQVNSATERRIIFSVWSPFVTDNPEEIPESDRIRVIRKDEHTIAHDFGNEGSGGHSRVIFPWKAGVTYGFLNSVRPDGKGNTIYSAWFFDPETAKWQFITSFLRPKTNTWLKRPHSFLENFLDDYGHHRRMAWYGNQWACDTEGRWHQLTEARFTGDDIARRGYRLDYAGGAAGERFYLKNGGFFHPNTEIGTMHQREPGSLTPPAVNFTALP